MRKYFSEDYIIPSPKLNEHQKKGLRQKFKCFFFVAKIRCRITVGLFRLIIQHSNLDEGTPKSRWGNAKSRWGAVFPINAKKCEIFSGIFALKFCEFRRFFSRQKPAFLFPAKNRRQLRFTASCSGMSHKLRRKLAELRQRTFFFLEINRKSAKKMHPSAR